MPTTTSSTSATSTTTPVLEPYRDVLVIGAGQAGLSAAYFLDKLGLGGRYQVLDHAPGPGGAWQFRWPTLTLAGANGVHDLPGYGLKEALGVDCEQYPASTAVADYYRLYEERFALDIRRPVRVSSVRRDADGFVADCVHAETGADLGQVRARTLINATGTWDRPFVPHVPGIETFRGRQLHTHGYTGPEEFAGRRVLVVGAGISATQLLIEIARNAPGAQVFWCSRTEPVFDDAPFDPAKGRAAVARVEERVRAGLPPTSVVSVTGLPLTPALAAARDDGLLDWRPMFTGITETGVTWDCGATWGPGEGWAAGHIDPGGHLDVDVIFWNTGFRSALDHLAPLRLRAPGGGITMTGRLATVVADDPYVQLLGYGPSASTIGANRAGREAARHVAELLS